MILALPLSSVYEWFFAEFGLFSTKKKSHIIQEFASNRAKVILTDLDGFQDKLDLLYLISKFDFIS